jgi:hypothetical protein
MGAPLLIVAALALLAGCQPAAPGEGQDPHAGLACTGCHSGPVADLGRAAVPNASCTASGCHTDGGPARVQLATATFAHRNHGAEGDIQLACAGCHTHPTGEAPLRASVDACALCHLPDVRADSERPCQACHQEPRHVTLTSAGIPVPHATLPWVEIGCVRCHYDVAEPPVEVATSRCAECHRDVNQAMRRGVGRDLHPLHGGFTCVACHASDTHHVRAISSAVELVCSDCHTRAHDLALTPWTTQGSGAWEASATCSACHTEIHRSQQQLLLGLVPTMGEVAMASQKFVGGMTCRSCHIPPRMDNGAPPEQPIRGQALACASCHGDEYRQVLDWWVEGVDARLERSSAFLATAQRELGPGAPDSARELLASSAAMLQLVRDAGGQHNLELTDRIFRESVRRTAAAYRAAGRPAPATPRLGPAPHSGLCAGCHYDDRPLDMRTMPSAFHEGLVREIPRDTLAN